LLYYLHIIFVLGVFQGLCGVWIFSGIWVVLSSVVFLKDMTMLKFLSLYLQLLLGQWLWILLLWYLLMEHQQRNCNSLPTNLQHLEVKTEQEVEVEAEAEAGAEVEAEEYNNFNFNSSPTNHHHLLHHHLLLYNMTLWSIWHHHHLYLCLCLLHDILLTKITFKFTIWDPRSIIGLQRSYQSLP
jgi:hypothetical protein